MEIMLRFERGVLGSSPGRGTDAVMEGPPDWRREPVGSRSSRFTTALRVQLPPLPLQAWAFDDGAIAFTAKRINLAPASPRGTRISVVIKTSVSSIVDSVRETRAFCSRSVVDARDPAKVVDQVRLPARTLTQRC